MLELYIRIKGQYETFGACIDIPELITEEFKPIDECTNELMAYVLPNGVTTHNAERIRVVRKDAANLLAAHISELIVDAMEQHDMVDGRKL